MFYCAKGWFRDLTCFSAFVVFSNALVGSGYGQQSSSVMPGGVAARPWEVTSGSPPFARRVSAPPVGPRANTGSGSENQLFGNVRAPNAITPSLTGRRMATDLAKQSLSAGRNQKQADASLMARLKSKFMQPRLQTGTSADDPTDPYIVNQAAALHNDPQQMFAFVRDQIAYQAYSGSLRGARGTLWSKAGNALDRASLLVALLRASGFTAQYVQGTLTTAQEQSLILSMFQSQYRVLGCPPASSALADPVDDPNLQAIAGDHYWVQYANLSGGPFTDADTAFPNAMPGQTFGTAAGTSAAVPTSEEILVTFSENAETFSQAGVSVAGNGLSTNTVLSQQFLTTDLIGKPVTLGQFVNSTSLGTAVTFSTNTYSPYLIVGGVPANTAGDQVIRGTDFQEVLTNFPQESQVLTGLVANVTITYAGSGNSETFTKTLFDRIGFAARAAGSPPPISIGPGSAPALDTENLATFNVLGGLQDDSIIRAWAATNDSLLAAIKAIQPQLGTTGNPNPAQTSLQTQADTFADELMINTERILTAQFAEASDNLSARFASNWYLTAYLASPRLLVATSRVSAAGNGNTLLEVGFDTLKDDIQVVLPPGQSLAAGNAYRTNRGLNESYLESQLLANFAAAQTPVPGNTLQVAVSAADVLAQAANQGIGATVLASSDISLAAGLNLSADANARITQAVSNGSIVFAPNQAVTINGVQRTGWVQFQTDGTATGVLEDGSHGALVEYTAVGQLQSALISGDKAAIAFFIGFPSGWAVGMIANYVGTIISGSFELNATWRQDLSAFSTYLIDKTVLTLADGLATTSSIDPGFQPGLSAAEFGWTTASLMSLPPALFGGSAPPALAPGSSVGVTSQVQPDPNFLVPVNGAQMATVFDLFVTNTGPAADTFNLSFANPPAGFTLQSSLSAILIPAGGQAEIGVCAVPTGQIPNSGTNASFNVTAASSSNPAIQTSAGVNFSVPSVASASLMPAASALSTTPGTPVPTTLTITGTGNAAATVTLTVVADPNLTVAGIQSPVTVNPGQTVTQSLTLTPSASAPLNSVLNVQITGAFGSPANSQKTTTGMSLSVETAQAVPAASAAPIAAAAGRPDLAASLNLLGGVITALAAGCSPTTLGAFQNYSNNLLTQIDFSTDSNFIGGVFPNGSSTLSLELQTATCSNYAAAITDLNTVIAAVSTLVSSSVAGVLQTYNPSNLLIQVTPQSATAGPGTNAVFQVQLTNVGPVADWFSVVAATDMSANPQLPSLFGALATQPVIAPGQTLSATLLVPVPPGTTPGSVPVLISAIGQNFGGQGQASATVNVAANGLILAAVSASNTLYTNGVTQLIVTNTGSLSDTFALTLSGPGALFSALSPNSVTLAAGASQTVNISVGNPGFLSSGATAVAVTGTSQGNAAVTATLNLAINVPNTLGVAARFQPSSQNTPAVFPLIVQNIGTVQDTYTATITNITGNIQANLINLDGTSTQQIPQFILPGLATGQIYLNASGTPPGSVTVTISSLTSPMITASATANICQGCAQAPIANAGAPQNVPLGQPATLDGSASSDPNTPPLPLTYTWTVASAPGGSSVTSASIVGASAAMASFTPDIAGLYTFQLTVNNGAFSSSANVTFPAGAAPGGAFLPPVAVAGKNRNVAEGKYFLLDGSASFDPGAYPLTYQWLLRSAPQGSTASLANAYVPEPAFRPDAAGTYVFQLSVNNGAFSSVPSTVTITSVGSGNVPPNANAGSGLNALEGSPITVDGSASYDPDNGPNPLTYSWQFTQVPTGSALTGALKASGATATFTPDVAGAYTLTLTVSDGAATGTDTVVVTASNPSVAPNVNPGKPRRVLPNVAIALDGSASNDPDNDALTYQWQPVDNFSGGGSLENASFATANFTAAVTGQYVARLDVNDAQSDSFQQVAIIVGTACDGNGDGLVNQIDLDLISGLIGAAVPANDPLDADGDGVITAADLAACSLQQGAPITLTLVSSANPSTPGQTITFTATLKSDLWGTPTGTIQFLDGAAVLGTVNVSNGQAVFSTTLTTGDTHTITAQYSGDTVFQPTKASITQTQGFPGAISLVLKLTSSANPAAIGQTVTFTVSFLATGGNPTGTVRFSDGLTPLGTAPVTNRKATFSTSKLTGGSHAIIANYGGDKTFQPTITSLGEVISPLATTLTLTASTPSVAMGQSIVFTAQIKGTAKAGVAPPTGQVLFEDDGSPAGTATLDSGRATLTLTTLLEGDHIITAIYTGDSNWAASHGSVAVHVTLPVLRLTNAASNSSASFAADEIVSMFNVSGLSGNTGGTLPLTTALGGVTVTVEDSAGAKRAALLYGAFASTGQVNFVIPAGTALGAATIIVTAPSGSQTAQITIKDAAPGLFTANQNGRGAPTGQVVMVHADGSHTVENLAAPSGGTYVATTIKLTSPTDQVFLQLYGTGIRHASKVTAAISGAPLTVTYAGQQGTYPGLDQVNLQLPKALEASGALNVVVTAEGQAANDVMIVIQ